MYEIEISKLSIRKEELRSIYKEGIITFNEIKEYIEKIKSKMEDYNTLINEVEKDVYKISLHNNAYLIFF